MKNGYAVAKWGGILAMTVCLAFPAIAGQGVSANYTAPPGMFANGGGQGSSANFRQSGVLGYSFSQVNSGSANYQGGSAISALLPASTSTTITTTTSTSVTTVSSTTTTTVMTLNLAQSWNLVGNSVNAPLDVVATFGNASKVNTVWKWLPATSKWAFYTPSQTDGGVAYAATKGYDALTTINGGEGYWVNAKTAFTAQMPAGTSISTSYFQNQTDSTQNKLLKGWNLIATGDSVTPSVFNQGLSVTSTVQGVIPLNVTTLWAWDNLLSNWYFYAPNLEASGGLVSYITSKSYLDFTQHNKTLGQGVGFWVNKP